MENHTTDSLSVRSSHTKVRGKPIGGRSKSPGDPWKCWKRGKLGNFKKKPR